MPVHMPDANRASHDAHSRLRASPGFSSVNPAATVGAPSLMSAAADVNDGTGPRAPSLSPGILSKVGFDSENSANCTQIANTFPAVLQARLASTAVGAPSGYFEKIPVPLRRNSVPAL